MATDVLPNELLARVLCVLPPRDLCQAHRVCRRWAALLRDDDDDDHDHGGGGGGGGNASVVWRDAFRHTWKCDAPFLWTTTSSTGSRSSWRKEYLRRAWLVGAFDAGAAVKTQVHPHIGRIDHLALARDSSNGSSWFLAASEATSTIIRFSAGAGGQQRHQQHVLGGSGMTPLSWVHVVPSTIVAGHKGGHVKLLELKNNKFWRINAGYTSPPTAWAALGDLSCIASAHENRCVRLIACDVTAAQAQATAPTVATGLPHPIVFLIALDKLRLFVAATASGSIRTVNSTLEGPAAALGPLFVQPPSDVDMQLTHLQPVGAHGGLLGVFSDGTIRVWAVDEATHSLALTAEHKGDGLARVTSLAIEAVHERRLFCTGSSDGKVALFAVPLSAASSVALRPIYEIATNGSPVVRLHIDSHKIVAATETGHVFIFDVLSQQLLRSFNNRKITVTDGTRQNQRFEPPGATRLPIVMFVSGFDILVTNDLAVNCYNFDPHASSSPASSFTSPRSLPDKSGASGIAVTRSPKTKATRSTILEGIIDAEEESQARSRRSEFMRESVAGLSEEEQLQYALMLSMGDSTEPPVDAADVFSEMPLPPSAFSSESYFEQHGRSPPSEDMQMTWALAMSMRQGN